MTTEDFLKRVNEQPPLTITRTVSVPGPQLKALLAERKPTRLSELMAHPDQHRELQTFRYAHVLGPGASDGVIEAWQAAHPEHPLPLDLREFLARVDGVHLWADVASSRAYFGILSLKDWQDARHVDWVKMFDSAPVGRLVISYHDNGDNFLVLDTKRPDYLWYDLEDFDNPKSVGETVAQLLDFWWEETAWLGRRRDSVAG